MDFYKNYENFMEFASATVENPFGAELLALCSDRFDDLPTAVYELTEGLGELGFDVDEDGVIGLMTGEIIPSEELLEAISGLAQNDVEIGRLRNSAAAAYDLAASLIEAGEVTLEDDDEDEDDDDDDFPVTQPGVTYEQEDDYLYEDEEEESEEEDLAVALYSRQVVEDELNNLADVADQMMDSRSQGLMTPHIKELLFGRNQKNRYMNFSSVCETEGYTPEEYLKCIEFSLNLLAELGGVDSAYFESQADEEIAQEKEIAFSRRTSSNYADELAIEEDAKEMIGLLNL